MRSLLLRPVSGSRPAFQRLAALVVLALQVAVAVAPVWEERPGVRLGAHAEEQGSQQHAEQHNEESCVVCAARASAQAAAAPMPEIAFASADPAPFARVEYAASDIRTFSTRSRAPPAIPN